MPRGPKGERRPRDPNALAKTVIGIATGEIEDREPSPQEQGKDPAAAALGKKGGLARAKKMSPAERQKIAKRAAKARWKK
jgi:hypothetical protein